MGDRCRRIAAFALLGCALTAAGSARAGETYRQPILYEWDRLAIDVIVLPPGHGQIYNDAGLLPAGTGELDPIQNSYTRAIAKGIGLWRTAVARHGPRWLASGLKVRTFVAGRDALPSPADAEIVVGTAESMGPVLGTSYPSKPCPAVVSKTYHVSFTENDVVNIAAHEVGHCLGLAHIDGSRPADDLMQAVYQHPDGLRSTPVHCPSNLNVAGLANVFGRAAGRTGGGTAAVADSAYDRAC